MFSRMNTKQLPQGVNSKTTASKQAAQGFDCLPVCTRRMSELGGITLPSYESFLDLGQTLGVVPLKEKVPPGISTDARLDLVDYRLRHQCLGGLAICGLAAMAAGGAMVIDGAIQGASSLCTGGSLVGALGSVATALGLQQASWWRSCREQTIRSAQEVNSQTKGPQS